MPKAKKQPHYLEYHEQRILDDWLVANREDLTTVYRPMRQIVDMAVRACGFHLTEQNLRGMAEAVAKRLGCVWTWPMLPDKVAGDKPSYHARRLSNHRATQRRQMEVLQEILRMLCAHLLRMHGGHAEVCKLISHAQGYTPHWRAEVERIMDQIARLEEIKDTDAEPPKEPVPTNLDDAPEAQ
jgi:hypothetical protein